MLEPIHMYVRTLIVRNVFISPIAKFCNSSSAIRKKYWKVINFIRPLGKTGGATSEAQHRGRSLVAAAGGVNTLQGGSRGGQMAGETPTNKTPRQNLHATSAHARSSLVTSPGNIRTFSDGMHPPRSRSVRSEHAWIFLRAASGASVYTPCPEANIGGGLKEKLKGKKWAK